MTAIADALAAMAEGRRAPISPAKGHTGGTTPVEDVSVDDVVESLVDSSDDSQPKPHARRHRHRRRKSPGQGSDSERRATSAESQDMHPNESSPGANSEQPQRDSNPCLHLERVAGTVREFAEMASDQGFEHSAIRVVCHRFSTSHGHRRTKFSSWCLDIHGAG